MVDIAFKVFNKVNRRYKARCHFWAVALGSQKASYPKRGKPLLEKEAVFTARRKNIGKQLAPRLT